MFLNILKDFLTYCLKINHFVGKNPKFVRYKVTIFSLKDDSLP